MEVDLSGALELLDDSLMERGYSRSEVVYDDKEMPITCVDRILRSELKGKGAGGANKR